VAHTELRAWIVDQVAEHLYVEDLVEKAGARLRTHRIILPACAAFERIVNEAHAEAKHQMFERLAQSLSDETKQAIDGLLSTGQELDRLADKTESPTPDTNTGGTTDFFRFAQYPPEAKAKHIVTYLEWADELRALDLDPLDYIGVAPTLLDRLSTAVRTYDAQQLKAFNAAKRYALAAAFLYDTRKRLLDYLVEMHAQFMTEMQREARNTWEKEHRQVRQRLHQGVTSLRELAKTVLTLRTLPEAPLSTLLDHIDPKRLEGAVEDCVKFERLERHGLLDKRHSKYANFRRSFRSFVDLPFAAESGSESMLDNLALLRQLNRGNLKRRRRMTTPPLSQSAGEVVYSPASRADVAPGRFPWPSGSKRRCAVAMCFCPPRVSMYRFGNLGMTNPPGKRFASPPSTPWISPPMVQLP
jgi:hypothetical protein